MESLSQVSIVVDLKKLRYNLQHTYELCQEKGIDLAVVAKSVCADHKILEVMEASPASIIADSRLDNLASMQTNMKRLLIRPCAPQEARAVIAHTEMSMQTTFTTVQAIADAAEQAENVHDILLMIDLGDLRDGIYYTDEEQMVAIAAYIHQHPALRLAGLAANYNCLSGLQPNPGNMAMMTTIFHRLESYYDIEKPIVSCGNSSSVALLTEDKYPIPPEINQFRMGEAIVLGRDPSDNTLIPGYDYNVFILEVALIEIYEKPVYGKLMRRGVLSIGKQDIQVQHILPIDPRIHIIGACSDECVVDLSDAPEYLVGNLVKFHLEYNALMTLFAGHFINKRYV